MPGELAPRAVEGATPAAAARHSNHIMNIIALVASIDGMPNKAPRLGDFAAHLTNRSTLTALVSDA